MSDISNITLAKWSGRVATVLLKLSAIRDEWTDVRNLNDATDTKIIVEDTNDAAEVAKNTDRTSTTDVPQTERNLVHNASIEVMDAVHVEDQLQIPYKMISKKMPHMARKMSKAHTMRFMAYTISHAYGFAEADGGGLVDVKNTIHKQYDSGNTSLNADILDSVWQTRQNFIDNGVSPNPDECILAVNSFIFNHMRGIREIQGAEYVDKGESGKVRFRAYKYADMLITEGILGLNYNFNVFGNANTPSKFKFPLGGVNALKYSAVAWYAGTMVQGFAGPQPTGDDGSEGAGGAGMGDSIDGSHDDDAVNMRHIDLSVNYYWPRKKWVLNGAMIFDVNHAHDSGSNEALTTSLWVTS